MASLACLYSGSHHNSQREDRTKRYLASAGSLRKFNTLNVVQDGLFNRAGSRTKSGIPSGSALTITGPKAGCCVKATAKIKLPHLIVRSDFGRCAVSENLSSNNDICMVNDRQRLTDIVITNQYAKSQIPDAAYHALQGRYRKRIDTGKRFVKHEISGIGSKRASNFASAPHASGKFGCISSANRRQSEFLKNEVQHLMSGGLVRIATLQAHHYVVLNRKAPENRRFLREIAQPKFGTGKHRKARRVGTVYFNSP